jgi:hypothetical protein
LKNKCNLKNITSALNKKLEKENRNFQKITIHQISDLSRQKERKKKK